MKKNRHTSQQETRNKKQANNANGKEEEYGDDE